MDNPPKILVIEDDDILREALIKKIEKEGFIAIEARDGKEGLATATKLKPSLVLADILMPEMNGITMIEHMRQNDDLKETPVILLTNLDDKQEDAIKNKVYDYFVKANISLDDVIHKIREKLGIHLVNIG